ncbi:PAS and ANTAR domain-containing protein [Mycobacterium sp.]|uniref:PAS and ANTAR domain-containing protein n=1 Tax=Mycobacterium sp. TaxID=1785 RepID=UPI0025CED184|nr:PAS and ANTAR domain-containing protein [Mycobacterium sp.]
MADSRLQCDQTTRHLPNVDDHPATDGQAVRAIDKALLGGEPHRVGRFQYRYDSGEWTWSDTVARMHGYEPGAVEPTTEIVLSHKHPEDLARVKGLLQQSAAPFSSRHRIRTTTGETRNVVVVGDAVTDADGAIVATRGFYVDITDSVYAELQQSISDELEVIVSHREVIDQAKGMLMAIYQLSADAAFAILVWRSQELNIKLSTVADRLVAELPSLLNARPVPRAAIDHYLLSLIPPTKG